MASSSRLDGHRERRHLRDVQDLVGVGVADAGDEALVAQQPLDLRAPPGEQRAERLAGELVGQRVGAERGDAGHVLRVADEVGREPLLGAGLGEVEAGRRRRTGCAARSATCPGAARCWASASDQRSQPARARWKIRCTPSQSRSTNLPCRETASTGAPVSACGGGSKVFSTENDPSSTPVTASPTVRSARKSTSAWTSGSSGTAPKSGRRVRHGRGELAHSATACHRCDHEAMTTEAAPARAAAAEVAQRPARPRHHRPGQRDRPARRHDRQRRPPDDRARPRRRPRRAPVGGQRLRPDAGRVHPARRLAGRPVRATRDVCRGRGRLRRRLGALRPVAHRRGARRRPSRPGTVRRPAGAGQPRDPAGVVPPRRPDGRDRRVDRAAGRRVGVRPGRRRLARRARLEVGLLAQRAARRGGRRARAEVRTRVTEPVGQQAHRPHRHHPRRRRAGRAHLRADRPVRRRQRRAPWSSAWSGCSPSPASPGPRSHAQRADGPAHRSSPTGSSRRSTSSRCSSTPGCRPRCCSSCSSCRRWRAGRRSRPAPRPCP